MNFFAIFCRHRLIPIFENIRFDELKYGIVTIGANFNLSKIITYKKVMREACDCSPDCCKTNDTSYHFHIGKNCFHPSGSKHEICDLI